MEDRSPCGLRHFVCFSFLHIPDTTHTLKYGRYHWSGERPYKPFAADCCLGRDRSPGRPPNPGIKMPYPDEVIEMWPQVRVAVDRNFTVDYQEQRLWLWCKERLNALDFRVIHDRGAFNENFFTLYFKDEGVAVEFALFHRTMP